MTAFNRMTLTATKPALPEAISVALNGNGAGPLTLRR
jgi:hypothetical protein